MDLNNGGMLQMRHFIDDSCRWILSFRDNVELNDVEIGVGILSFLNWVKESYYTKDPYYVDYPSDSAREMTMIYMTMAMTDNTTISVIRRGIPSFDPHVELPLGLQKIAPDHPQWNRWKLCLVRTTIMMTRALAAVYSGSEGLRGNSDERTLFLGEMGKFARSILRTEIGTDMRGMI